MTVLSFSRLTNAGAARLSLGATRPMRKSEKKRRARGFLLDETRAGGAKPYLKSLLFHAIDLRQVEPSYKVRMSCVTAFSQTGRRMVGRLSRKLQCLYAEAPSRRVAAEPTSGFEEEYLTSIKRRKLLRHLNRQSKRKS